MPRETSSARTLFVAWYDSLPNYRDNIPARGTLAGALAVLDRLKKHYVLDIDAHTATKGQSQIAGVGKGTLSRILKEFGEERPFLSEGGRTNRGLRGSIQSLLKALENAGLQGQS